VFLRLPEPPHARKESRKKQELKVSQKRAQFCFTTHHNNFLHSEVTRITSSCAENTELVGINYLKEQPPVLAMPDTLYPPWLWTLLEPNKSLKFLQKQARKETIRQANEKRKR
jgi:hypothetical protein